MAKIKNYLPDNNITDKDIVIGSDGDVNGVTKNFNVATLKEHILKDLPGTPTLEQVVTAGNTSSKDIVLNNTKKITGPDGKKFLQVNQNDIRIIAYTGDDAFPDTEARVQVETNGAILIQGEAAQVNVKSAMITGQDLTFKGLEYAVDNSANFTDRSLVDKGYVDGEIISKADLVGGKVPSEQLPSYVDDVIEVANFAGLPLTGESGKIYITIDDNKSFRWGGSVYIAIGGGSQNLQSVTETGATTDRAITVQGVTISGDGVNDVISIGGGSGISNTGANITNIGRDSGGLNIGNNVTNIGVVSGTENTGNYVTNIGRESGRYNTGDFITNIGDNAGSNNTLDNVINIGQGAQATATNQLALNTGISNTAINLPATSTELTLRASASVESIAYLSDLTSGGTPFSKEEFTYAGVQTFTLAATPAFIAAVFVNGQELNTTQFSTLTNVLTIVDTLETGDKVNILYNPASIGIAQYYTKTEIDNFNFEESHPDFVEVNSLANLPAPSGGVIELIGGYTYLILKHIDLLGSRLVCGQDTVIVGWSSENCSITSTGLSAGTALITSVYSLPIRSISFTHGLVFDLQGDGTTTALDWFGVNLLNCASGGTIKNYTNFVFGDGALLDSGGFTFDGTIGTIAFSNTLFNTASATTAINVLSTCTISRRLRIIYSSFVTLSGETGINFSSSATVGDEKYILDTVNFSGGGTYLTGVNDTSNKALFSNCVGITNTSTRGFMYMLNNATDTTIGAGNANVWIKAAGTTIAGTNSKYTHTTNRLTYTGAFVGSVLVTLNATVRSGSVNQNISIGVAKNGTVLPESEGIVRTSTANAEHGGSTQAVLEIASTDYIELFVRNTSVSDVRVTDFNFNVIKIPV